MLTILLILTSSLAAAGSATPVDTLTPVDSPTAAGSLTFAAPGDDTLPAMSGLLALDRAVGEAVRRNGLAAGLAGSLSDSGVIVYPGAPVVVGKSRVRSLLAAQPVLDSLTLHWAPVDGWISQDRLFGVTYGRVEATRDTATRKGTYLAGWREERGVWRLVALQLNPGVILPRPTLPGGLGPIELAPAPATGSAREMIQADLDFSALAGSIGAPDAFAKFAAPEAIVIGGAGTRRGPAEIRAGLAAGAPADWSWFPVVAFASKEGDLGVTVGQAVIRPKAGGEPAYSKYLTVWRRGPDGQVRFLSDAGNPRPRP